ncbi:MAG: sodium:calcium antiporter [Candidatus Levybacteria bacterium]|nr:sodium:calcium antiporter [Candidatus Levybacteria bacterium]
MLFIDLIIYVAAFFFIWLGSGFIVSSTSKFSEKLKLSSFAVSFLLLGILTSTPEFSVGLQAVADHNPGIFVGNLLGGIVVIFLFIIPLLAIFGNGINLRHEMDNKTLLATMGVILAPSVTVLDKKVTNLEGFVLIILYLVLVFVIQRKNGLFSRENNKLLEKKSYSFKDILKILVGIAIVFISSSLIVDKTTLFAEVLNVPVFYIGLVVIALGTDLPEMTLAIRSVISGKKDIAMGDYVGAGAASTLLFGIFTILNKGEVITISSFIFTFGFIASGLGLFYYFSRAKNFISRKNGIFMIFIYISFIVFEVTR